MYKRQTCLTTGTHLLEALGTHDVIIHVELDPAQQEGGLWTKDTMDSYPADSIVLPKHTQDIAREAVCSVPKIYRIGWENLPQIPEMKVNSLL